MAKQQQFVEPPARRCAICGELIPPDSGRRRYCSEMCARKAEKARARTPFEGKPHASTYKWHVCADCGKEFYGNIKSYRCPECQVEADKAHNREFKARKRAGHTRKLGSTDVCERCGKPYIVEGGLQRYCKDCREIAWRENNREASKAWNRNAYSMPEAKAAKAAEKRITAPLVLSCAWCGREFTSNSRRSYCSEECKRQGTKANYRRYHRKIAEKRKETKK